MEREALVKIKSNVRYKTYLFDIYTSNKLTIQNKAKIL